MPKPIVVFDCVTLVQSVLNRKGPAGKCVDQFEAGLFSLAISKYGLAELEDVLSRSSLRNDYPHLTDENTKALLATLLKTAKLYRRVKKRFTYPRDPKDEPYVNLALEAKADFLVTRDSDLLDLMRWDKEEGRDFQKRFRSLKIIDPVTFLREIEQPKTP